MNVSGRNSISKTIHAKYYLFNRMGKLHVACSIFFSKHHWQQRALATLTTNWPLVHIYGCESAQ